MKIRLISPLFLALSIKSGFAQIVVSDNFSFAGDLANDPAFTATPGNDASQGDLFGVDKPLTIPVENFTSVGTDKLVGVLTLHNSAAQVSQVTGLTYGGVDIFTNIVVEDGAGGGNAFSTQIIFYLDSPASDGNLVIQLGATENVDEAGLALFALQNAEPGFLEGEGGNQNPAPLAVSNGDFVVAVSHRNNGSTPLVSAPFTQVDLTAGNMKAGGGFLVATEDGTAEPTFSTGQSSVIASFRAGSAPAPTSLTLAIEPISTGSGFQLVWNSRGNRIYTIRSSNDLSGDFVSWNLVEENIPASETGTNSLTINPAELKNFYRIQETIAPAP